LSADLAVPILNELAPGGFSFGHGYLIEFEPQSIWYETSFAITAAAVKQGIKTEYHTFMHAPTEVRKTLTRLGMNVEEAEKNGLFRVIDTYTASLGRGTPEKPTVGKVTYQLGPFNLAEWSSAIAQQITEEVPPIERRWLHIDDNTSVFIQSHDEKEIVNTWRTRFLPWARKRERILIMSIISGGASDAFYKQCESIFEGIIDFKSQEEDGEIRHYARVRTMRGKTYDTRWRPIRLEDSGAVTVQMESVKPQELGIGGWLKGSKK